MDDIILYHNPACGTSRNTLALIRAAGIEPVIIEYLKTPPSRQDIRALALASGQPLRALLREKDTPYAALGLSDPGLTDVIPIQGMASAPHLDFAGEIRAATSFPSGVSPGAARATDTGRSTSLGRPAHPARASVTSSMTMPSQPGRADWGWVTTDKGGEDSMARL